MIDGPTLFDGICGFGMLFSGGWSIWLAESRRQTMRSLDISANYADYWIDEYKRADGARRSAIAALEAYTKAEPTRFEAWRKDKLRAHLKLIAVKGNQSPKRKRV